MIFKRNIVMIVFLLFSPIVVVSASVTDDMQRIGQGQAYYLGFIKVYDISLYSAGIVEGHNILSRDVSKCLYIKYTVDIGKDDFVKAANTVLNRQFSEKQLVLATSDIETLHEGYRDVEDGDTYTLCYSSADSVTTLSYNGGELVSVDSPGFAEIYFSIWLGSTDPLDEDLRDDLLAGLLDN